MEPDLNQAPSYIQSYAISLVMMTKNLRLVSI